MRSVPGLWLQAAVVGFAIAATVNCHRTREVETLAPLPTPSPEASPSEDERITALLDAIGSAQGVTFIRNDVAYPAAAARRLMEYKWNAARGRIRTTDEFIDQVATRSSTTGRAYLVRDADGRTTESAFWLRARLAGIQRDAR